ncbi:uncharacterized protein PHACADRAFT_192128 [Phanerochaete carnosa HHB-10118-sp]|uniref:Uncharacterized protein n=1 Tax=Phanerochaete carnosa (strain HHB-10118-sp) TaxID=650164 RepID=K5XA06_PHACS|nr:uncharacterized protein PHACADRAFT_192128 [Phanerochaete carnosa HHB-10118-sp]EKM59752.1 hypothetical protein PHACADRAFT_192128 [Phanerochaete carnosa HHB-10118-sp]
MAPTTRGKMRASTSKVTLEDTNGIVDEDHLPEVKASPPAQTYSHVDAGITALEGCASQLMKSLRTLKKDVIDLQKKNKQLQEDLDQAQEAADSLSQPKPGKKGGPGVKQLQAKVNALRKQVAELERGRERDRRKMAQLRAKEIRKDAEELQAQADLEVGDTAHKMRKLLRRFHDLMLAPSLEGDEECKICFEKLEPHAALDLRTYLLQGLHAKVPKDELEPVEYLASEQWDALLEVAKRWAKFDRRRELETSDEENEEQFVDDERETSETRSVSSKPEPESLGKAESSSPPPAKGKGRLVRRTPTRASSVASSVPGEEEVSLGQEADNTEGRVSTPPAAESSGSQDMPSYSQSPAKEKRRRLEQLAETRNKKPRL